MILKQISYYKQSDSHAQLKQTLNSRASLRRICLWHPPPLGHRKACSGTIDGRLSAAASNSSGAAVVSDDAAPSAPPSSSTLESASPGDLLCLQLPTSELYFEIEKVKKSRLSSSGTFSFHLEAICEGELVRIAADGAVEHVGYCPRISDPWVKACPALQAALKRLRKEQTVNATLPSAVAQQAALSSVGQPCYRAVTSLAHFEASVAEDPSPWCGGGEASSDLSGADATALLSAGELFAFLHGWKGVVLTQLELSFDPGTRIPLLRPYVLRMLRSACEVKGVAVLPSVAAGGAAVSLVLAPKLPPFKAWAAHLAEVGVQASLVADSPYYKLLVGRVLGYDEKNIVRHIQDHGQSLDASVIAAVDKELQQLSASAPALPWTKAKSSRGKR